MSTKEESDDEYVIRDAKEYVRHFVSRTRPAEKVRVEGLGMRIVKFVGDEPLTFTDANTLEQDPTCFMLGPESMGELLGYTPLQLMHKIGYQTSYIREKLQRGFVWRLFVVPPEYFAEARQATWAGALDVIERARPCLQGKLGKYLEELQSRRLEELERELGFDFDVARSRNIEDPNFLTWPRFDELANPTAAHVRAALYHSAGMHRLFTGDGYTLTADGLRGTPEYLAPNRFRTDVPGHVCVPLDPPTEDELAELERMLSRS